MIAFSIVNARKPAIVSKTFRLANGKVIKETAADIYAGQVNITTVRDGVQNPV